ncbi:alpha-mannosidase [Alkalibaculum bacchi]|uniref:glycoside hydrolase family 38 N-terminal domain-containing protein n=1 Tax=Alkalibaculum bacchi TaxID=645887 RepID=UPI0026F0E58C|nr:alpha-mannosidase [Alkalibaculum bacchi]
MLTAHLVNHTHWDREWYFSTMDALVLSEQLFTEVLNELENNPSANFTLDGQVSIVDEYVAIHPEAKVQIKKLVANHQLFIGPWYTQTDALLPDAESIIRNLVIGINDTINNYGEPMMVGYLPDTFGFNAQMPTLLQQVGIDNFIFWRGIDLDQQCKSIYFNWRGLGNKQVMAINFPFGYFTAQIAPESKKKIKEFVNERYDLAAQFEAKYSGFKDVLMPSGIDQMNIIHDINSTVRELNSHSKCHTVIDSYPSFVEVVRKKRGSLAQYSGELRLPRYARVHRTIGSIRYKIKKENFLLEILKRVEPLVVIGIKSGITINNGLLLTLWKKMLECQAHDSIGGCVSDTVAVDIMQRFKEANEIADGIENIIKRKLAEYLNLGPSDLLIFNTLPYHFVGRKSIELVTKDLKFKIDGMSGTYLEDTQLFPERHHILTLTPKGQVFTDEPEYFQVTLNGQVDLPGLGYRVLHILPANSEMSIMSIRKQEENSCPEISNGFQTLKYENNSLKLFYNKRVYPNFLQIVDAANDGDTYDYSPLKGDSEHVLPLQHAYVKTCGDKKQLIVIGAARMPLSLEDYDAAQPHFGNLEYKFLFEFNDKNQISVHLTINNRVFSHRVRLAFSPLISQDEAIFAGIQCGYVSNQSKPIPKNWNANYVEKPVNIFNFDKTVTVTNKKMHFTFWGAGEKEYEYNNGILYITLMSNTSYLGKPNLAWRPGRASGDTTNQGHVFISTPLAENEGLNKFDFAFELREGQFSMGYTNKITRELLSPSISYQRQSLNLFINRLDNKIWQTEGNPHVPSEQSLLELSDNYDVCAIYPAYRVKDSFVVRIQNMTNEPIEIPDKLIKIGKRVNALEEEFLTSDNIIPPFDLASILIPFSSV